MKKALPIAFLSAIFFSSTYIINRLLSVEGGYWRWSASLRHIFMLFILGAYLLVRGRLTAVFHTIKKNFWQWMLWSNVGFGLAFSFMTYGSFHGESWITVGVWQLSIVAGALMTPLFFHTVATPGGTMRVRNKIPRKALYFSLLILCGVAILQLRQAHAVSLEESLKSILPITLSAITYTLGNRKTMELCGDELDAVQRVFGMVVCSLPFWILLPITAVFAGEIPSPMQAGQVAIIAVFSGCLATPLFFYATNLVKSNPKQLAVIESTVVIEIVVTIVGSVLLGIGTWPDALGLLGLAIITIGMLCNSIWGSR